jgi:ferredoxin-thioredoxin reductase catalytic subunit
MSAHPTQQQVEARLVRIRREAEAGGYQLSSDTDFVTMLVEGLLVNEQRYGYPSCPCRIATGVAKDDLDIVCPCDYRDADLSEYESCYCALYVSESVARGIKKARSIPERRPPPEQRQAEPEIPAAPNAAALAYPVWRCRVCGYLCARDEPPDACPICKAKKERFERFM